MLWWIIVTVLTIIPMWKICPKFRLPEAAALVCALPYGIGILALLYVFAFRDQIKVPGVDR